LLEGAIDDKIFRRGGEAARGGECGEQGANHDNRNLTKATSVQGGDPWFGGLQFGEKMFLML
jgi:hypothetical protein